MLTRLKFLILTLLGGLMTVSCSSDEPDASSSEMKFDISITRSSTTLANITNRPFAVFADMIPTAAADKPEARTIIYHNTPVTFSGSAWTTKTPQYWFNLHDHSFVAVHPSEILADEANVNYSNSQLSFTYTLPGDHTLTHDILAATHRRRYTDRRVFDKDNKLISGSEDVVFLRFAHLMSQINISPAFRDNIMDREAYIEFHKVEFRGFRNKAVFNLSPASLLSSNQTDDRELNVNGHEGEGYYSIEIPKPEKIYNNGENVTLFKADNAIIMLPQLFAAPSDAQILLTYSISGEEEKKQVALSLEGSRWESGKVYNYRFAIDRVGPHLESTSITPWELAEVGNIDAH